VCDHRHLVLADHTGKTTVSSAGLVQVRDRLGIAPLKHLFDAIATRHGRKQFDAHRRWGLAVLGIDGTTFRVPDNVENRAISRCFRVVHTVRVPIRRPEWSA